MAKSRYQDKPCIHAFGYKELAEILETIEADEPFFDDLHEMDDLEIEIRCELNRRNRNRLAHIADRKAEDSLCVLNDMLRLKTEGRNIEEKEYTQLDIDKEEEEIH